MARLCVVPTCKITQNLKYNDMHKSREAIDEQQKALHIADVGSSYYWMINTVSYSVDGIDVKKGQMVKKKKGDRLIVNDDWRPATEEEVNTKQYYKGNYFNLKQV